MKNLHKMSSCLGNERGFALITAIMMLFAATILALMVTNSSDIEILLSGAQQRYENNFNVSEGASSVEAAAVGSAATITRNGESRSYAVVNPGISDQVLSPSSSGAALFDPGNDMTIAASYTVDLNTTPDQWPMDNLLHSDSAADNQFDYHYRTVYEHATTPPKGYDATKFSGYLFQVSSQRTTLIELGGNKVGPKATL